MMDDAKRLEDQPKIDGGDVYVIPSYRLAYLIYKDAPKAAPKAWWKWR